MSGHFPRDARRIIEAPLRVPGARKLVGDALWLYVTLASLANHRGVVVRQSDRLADDVGLDEQQLREWLERLSNCGLIEVGSPAPYLVIKLRTWPNERARSDHDQPEMTAKSVQEQRDVPVSGNAAAASRQSKDGGAGEGGRLLREVLMALGESDPSELQPLIERHSERVVREALHRVQATPASQIRKSKAALFRYLLAKLS